MEAILTEDEQRLLTITRDSKYELEAYEYAYDISIQSIRWKKRMLEFMGFLVAVGFLYVLYFVKARPQTPQSGDLHDIIGLIGTGVSLIVLVISIWGYIEKWDSQLERKFELSLKAHDLVALYDKAYRKRPVQPEELGRLADLKTDFDTARKHELAVAPRWAIQQGHQHVAMKYPDPPIKCNVCRRDWSPELAKNRRWTRLPYYGCEGCGV